ncbi:MAG: transcription termination/antitermination protein NusG [Akkermansia sp.]
MSCIPESKKQWYVMHVLSGQEGRVRDRILRKVEAEEFGDRVFNVLVPTEMVSEVRNGKKTETKRKFFPGYVLVNMDLLAPDRSLNKEVWYFMLQTDGVIGFAGSKDKPMPMRDKDVEAMLSQIQERSDGARPKVQFEVGDTVRVAEGPFQSQEGTIEEIDPERGKLRVSVSIFGRSTPVELEYWQVEKA